MQKSILILRIGSLGDTVVALPAFHHIRRVEANARIVLLTNVPTDGGVKAASSYQVLAGSGLVDDYAEYRPPRRALDALMLLRILRRERPLRLYYLMPRRSFFQRLRDRVFFHLAGIADVRGLDLAGRFDAARPAIDGIHWEAESLRLLRRAGGERNELTLANFDLRLTLVELGRAREVLGLLGPTPYLLISLGTKLPVNDWGDENWEATLRSLSDRMSTTALVMIGSADEHPRCARLGQAWQGRVLNLCGRLTPRESGAVATGAVAFLGHDSGPAHLAAAVGTTVVTIFAARNLPGVWFPFGNEAHALYERTECFACGLAECHVEGMRCIRSITPTRVVDKLLSVVAGRSAVAARPVVAAESAE